MATTNDGIWTPDQTDLYKITADLNTMASTVQDALEVRANAWAGTSSQRAAFASSAPEGAIWVDTNGDKKIWKYEGNTWVEVWSSLPVPFGRLEGGNSQTIPSNSYTSLTFSGGTADLQGGVTRSGGSLIAPSSGIYSVSMSVRFQTGGSLTRRGIRISATSGNINLGYYPDPINGGTISGGTEIRMSQGDSVRAQVYVFSGTDNVVSEQGNPFLSLTKIG